MFPNVLLIALGIFLSGLPFTCGAEASAPIKLQLKWKHQFQFAGYYAAVEQGYYRAAGLEVTLIEGGPHLDFGGLIASNAVQYTVGLPSMLLRRNEGLPVVALAAIYQHSPEVMLVREDSGITNPQQMAGRRLMMAVEDTPGVLAMFRNEGLPDGAIKRIPYDFNLERLINREIDGIGAYITDEPLYFKSRGVEVRAIRPQTYGVDFYGDCLFTSKQELIQHPEQVKAFVDASLKGWQYAMHHVDEMVDVIVQRYHPEKSREDLRYEAARMAELMFPDLIEAGHMNTGRWKHIADTYVRLGMLKPDYSLEGFIYDRNPPHDPSWARWTIGGVALFAIGLGSVTVYLMRMTRRIARAEHEAQEARVVLQSVLDAIPIGVYWKNRKSAYLGCNRVFATLAGLANPEEIRNKVDSNLPHGPESTEMRKAEELVLTKGIEAPLCDELVLLGNDQQHRFRRWILPLCDGKGRIMGVVGVTQEITGQSEDKPD